MNKRIEKRHKREVLRKKNKAKLSEPDLRSPEEIKAARDKSRPAQGWHKDPHANYSKPSKRGHSGSIGRSPAKVEG